MSYTTIIVSEDPTNNGYILTPLIKRVLAECGKPSAKVSVLGNPRTMGFDHAKAVIRNGIAARYRYVDLLLFLPDADGKNRHGEFAALESEARDQGTNLICCAAEQEVETWLLSGHLHHLNTDWQTVRTEVSVKEVYFEPFLKEFGNPKKPGGGREDLMKMTLESYNALKGRCPELAFLELRILGLLSSM